MSHNLLTHYGSMYVGHVRRHECLIHLRRSFDLYKYDIYSAIEQEYVCFAVFIEWT